MHTVESIIFGVRKDAKLTAGGREYHITCPSPDHDDTNPSCHINSTTGTWHCKSCDAGGSLKKFILLTYNVSDREAARMSKEAKGGLLGKEREKEKKREIVGGRDLPRDYIAKYEYKDQRGYCYAMVYRKSTIKALPYTHMGDNRWVVGAPDSRLPYRTETLRGKHLLIVEGEKCADAAAEVVGEYFDVVTWMGGTHAAHLTDWTAIRKHVVYLWPDNDRPGQIPMKFIQAQLFQQDCEVYTLKIPEDYPEKWDVADAIQDWGSDSLENIGKFICDHRVKFEPEVNPFREIKNAPAEPDYDEALEQEFSNEEDTAMLTKTSRGLRQALTILGFHYRYNVRKEMREVRRMDANGNLYKAWYKKIGYPSGWIAVDDHIRATLIDLIERQFKMQSNPNKPLDLSTKFDALFLAATVDRRVDDFKEWLDELPPWDGEDRIGMVAFDILGAYNLTGTNEADQLLKHMSKSLFIAPIQRTMDPGCALDEITVLLGPGEIGKTKFYSYVFPEECQHWYAGPIDFTKDTRKEMIEMTNGPVVVEIGEMRLSTLNETQINRMKDYITRGYDRVRLAYDKNPKDIPRRYSLIATANKKSTGTFYYDVDGHRRFLVVDVLGCKVDGKLAPKVAIKYLKENRLQLWAEALHLYKEGERANVPPDLRYWQKQMAERHVEIDEAYDGKIAHLETQIRVGAIIDYSEDVGLSLFDIASHLEFNVGDATKFSKPEQYRLSKALSQRKWEKRQVRFLDGGRPYRWFPPVLKIEQKDE